MKAIQHLKEEDKLTGTKKDVQEECQDELQK
jgi:hypothetical protein